MKRSINRPHRQKSSFSGFANGLRLMQHSQAAIHDLFVKPIQTANSELDYQQNINLIKKGEIASIQRSSSLGTLAQASSIGLVMKDNNPGGSYMGCLDGKALFNPSDKHEMIVGLAGSGKTTTIAYPKIISLGMGENPESVICVDVKGELWGSTSAGREFLDGYTPIVINPWNMYGVTSTRLNIFADLLKLAEDSKPIKDAILSKTSMIHPSPESKGANAWIASASMRISSCILAHLITQEPERASPATMADISTFSQSEFAELMVLLTQSPACDGWVADVAKKLLDQYGASDDPKYFEWVMEDYASAWEMYGKGSVLREETLATDFDFTELKRTPRAVYIMIPPRYLSSHGKYVALLLDVLIDIIAAAKGNIRTSFICDEFVNIPKAKCTLQALRLYRSYGIRLVVFAQDRDGFSKYKQDGGHKPFEENSIGLYWGLRDGNHMRDLQERAGYRYDLVGSVNASVGERLNTGGYSASHQRIPVLSVNDIGQIADGEAILEIPGQKLFVVERPFWTELPFTNELIRNLREHPLPDIDHL